MILHLADLNSLGFSIFGKYYKTSEYHSPANLWQEKFLLCNSFSAPGSVIKHLLYPAIRRAFTSRTAAATSLVSRVVDLSFHFFNSEECWQKDVTALPTSFNGRIGVHSLKWQRERKGLHNRSFRWQWSPMGSDSFSTACTKWNSAACWTPSAPRTKFYLTPPQQGKEDAWRQSCQIYCVWWRLH